MDDNTQTLATLRQLQHDLLRAAEVLDPILKMLDSLEDQLELRAGPLYGGTESDMLIAALDQRDYWKQRCQELERGNAAEETE